MRTGAAVAAILVIATAGAAGCGSDGSSGKSSTPAATETSADPAPKKARADIKDFEYEPREITVAAGGKVTWTNRDAANHTVTFKDEDGADTIPNLRKGQDGRVTFATAGTFGYICAYHPNMAGTVVVQ